MNARERVMAAIHHQPVDRIPTDIWATGEVWEKLRQHFGGQEAIYEALHIDGIADLAWPNYIGPPLPSALPDVSFNFWGIGVKTIAYPTGSYCETCHWPLAEARTIDDLERYAWPRPEWFDTEDLRRRLSEARGRRVTGAGYIAIFYFHNLLRGLERSLLDPYMDPDFTQHLLGRLSDTFYNMHRRIFETCEGLIDLCQVTDDYGSQTGPLIGLDTFREFGIRVFHHDDGAIRDFLPDLVGMGIDVLNPVQANCPGMAMPGLKRDFGASLCFHGGIDNQRVLPFGTPDEVRQTVREAIDTLGEDRTGYILAPCHNLQAVTPIENILAMYDEAWRYGG